jgi:tripartite ATP-independent transporter DctP family solute receptor
MDLRCARPDVPAPTKTKSMRENMVTNFRIAVALAASILMSWAGAGNAAARVLKLGDAQPPTIIVQQGLQHLADLVKERTKGAIEIQIFPNSQLGTEQQIIEGVKLGTIDMFQGSTGSVGAFLPPLEAFAHPYIWRDVDHMLKVVRGEIGAELRQRLLKEHGLRILDMGWVFGVRNLTTRNTPVREPADMKGLKIRVQPTAIYLATIKAMGGNPTPVDFNELYTSLQTGVVDGQENPFSLIYAAKFYEVQKYLMLTGHITQQQTVLINEDVFKSLTQDQQKILQEAVYESGDFQNKLVDADNAASLDKLKAAGMQVITPDIAAFKAATANVHKEFDQKWGKGFFERIEAVR